MALSTYFYDPFYDPLFTLVPSISRESTREDTNVSSGVMRPRMDLHSPKDTNEITATFELPGMRKEDVDIDVHNNRLVVSGQSSTSEDIDTDSYAVRERKYGRFSRTLPLPVGTKPEEINARMDNGVLTVKFPKSKPEAEAKRITVS